MKQLILRNRKCGYSVTFCRWNNEGGFAWSPRQPRLKVFLKQISNFGEQKQICFKYIGIFVKYFWINFKFVAFLSKTVVVRNQFYPTFAFYISAHYVPNTENYGPADLKTKKPVNFSVPRALKNKMLSCFCMNYTLSTEDLKHNDVTVT
jgi:hypothetical protein